MDIIAGHSNMISNKVLSLNLPFSSSRWWPETRRVSSYKIIKTKAEQGQNVSVIQKLGRVVKDKISGDIERVLKGTSKTRERLGVIEELVGYWTLESSEDTLQELEDALIMADFGPRIALKICDNIREDIKNRKIKTGSEIYSELKSSLYKLISDKCQNTSLNFGSNDKPGVIMVIGVNGGGKTTTIGKLAKMFSDQGAKVMLGAGDTFRAAAYEQLCLWGEWSNSTIGPFEEGKRPSAVLYKTLDKAIAAKDIDLLICDTSGRLHTNYGLMEELAKCKRTLSKRMSAAPHEVLLVLDGTTGLNMLNQAKEFDEIVGITGLILTKLDGTSKGGAVISVIDELGIPVKFIGVGEKVEDLQNFDAQVFVDAIFPNKIQNESDD